MRAAFIVALCLSVLGSASANAILARDYPACALQCIKSANLHGCNSVDFSCLCKNHQFLDETSQCIYDKCTNPDDLKQAVQTANAACKAAGVDITSTYTPTQSRSQTGQPTNTGSVTATTTGTGSPSTASSAAPTSTHNAATRTGSSGAAAFIGAAIFGALAF